MRFWILCLTCLSLCAQPQLQFEVASIKPSGPGSVRGSDGGPGSGDPIRCVFGQATLKDLIVTAWNLQEFQVSGAASLERAAFDLNATVPPGATKADFRIMLQNLLRERFALVTHQEPRDFSGYILTKTGAPGPQLSEWVPGSSAPPAPAGWPELPEKRPGLIQQNRAGDGYVLGRLRGRGQPISALVEILHWATLSPVVDRTEMPGRYNISLEYSMERSGGPPDVGADLPVAPSIFLAVQRQLGLKLTAAKVPFPVIVVESFDKMPSEN